MRKQETRKGKKGKNRNRRQSNHSHKHKSHTKSSHKRSHKRSHKHSHHRRNHRRIHGGSYLQATEREVDDMPVTRDAVITTSEGGPSMSVDAFKAHALYRDFQGLEQ